MVRNADTCLLIFISGAGIFDALGQWNAGLLYAEFQAAAVCTGYKRHTSNFQLAILRLWYLYC